MYYLCVSFLASRYFKNRFMANEAFSRERSTNPN